MTVKKEHESTAVLDAPAPSGPSAPSPAKAAAHAKIEEMRRRDQEMVTGVFRFVELPGGTVDLNYRLHKGEPIKKYIFRDGEEYTIPRGLADHLNNNCGHFEASHLVDAQGVPVINAKAKRIQRIVFSSKNF